MTDSVRLAWSSACSEVLICSAVSRSFAKERWSQQVVAALAFADCRLGCVDSFRVGDMSQCSMPGMELSVDAWTGWAMRTQRTLQVRANDWTLVRSSNRIDHATLRLIVATVSIADWGVQILYPVREYPPGGNRFVSLLFVVV